MAHRKMVVHKGKKGNSFKVRSLILTGHVN